MTGAAMNDYEPPRRDREYDPDDRRHRSAPSSGGGPLYYAIFLVLGVLIGGLALWALTGFTKFRGEKPGTDPAAQLREAAPAAPPDADEQEAVTLFERVRDSVVNVDVMMNRPGNWDDQVEQSGGAGFVWDTHGRNVTNYHVIEDAVKRPDRLSVRVVMADRSAYAATIIGVAPDNDLAVIQISAPKEKLKPIAIGTSSDLKVGLKAYAIGNPFGLSLTMT